MFRAEIVPYPFFFPRNRQQPFFLLRAFFEAEQRNMWGKGVDNQINLRNKELPEKFEI